MAKMDKQIKWLLDNNSFLTVNKIEIELDMPQGTLKKFVDGRRGLSDIWSSKVSEWIKNFRK